MSQLYNFYWQIMSSKYQQVQIPQNRKQTPEHTFVFQYHKKTSLVYLGFMKKQKYFNVLLLSALIFRLFAVSYILHLFLIVYRSWSMFFLQSISFVSV